MTAREYFLHRGCAAVLATCTGVALLSGCAAGQRAQSSVEFSVVDGVATSVGSLALRNVGVAAPPQAGYLAGGSAPLIVAVVNEGTSADRLVSVSSPVAGGASTAGATPSASPTGRAPKSGSASAAFAPITVPPGILTSIGGVDGTGGTAQVLLTGLKSTLTSGQSISVTFTFAMAGAVSLQIPIRLAQGRTGGATVRVSPTAQ